MASKRGRGKEAAEDKGMPGIVESVARSVECPVCKEVFEGGEQSKIPKLLPCFHTVCSHCIKGLQGGQGSADSSCKTLASCPICQKPLPARDGADLPTNFIALEVAETISLKSGIPKCCSLCDDGEASHFCSKCSAYMCEACKEAHSRQKLTKDHNVLTMEEASEQISRVVSSRSKMCEAHPTEMKDIFCVKCQAVACHKCVLLWHSQAKGHEYESLNAAYDKGREEVKALMGDSEECEKIIEGHIKDVLSLKDSLDRNADKAEEQLEEAFGRIVEILEERKTELLDEVRSIKTTKMKALSTQEDELGMTLLKSRTVREFAQEALEQECNVHLLSLKQGIVDGFKDAIKVSKGYSGPCETGDLTFISSPDERVKDLVGAIGNIIIKTPLEAGPKVLMSDDARWTFQSVKVCDGKIYALSFDTQPEKGEPGAKIEVYRGSGKRLSVFYIPNCSGALQTQHSSFQHSSFQRRAKGQQAGHLYRSLDRFAVALNSIFYVQGTSLCKFKLPASNRIGVAHLSWQVTCAEGQVQGGFANDVAVLSGEGVVEGLVFLSEYQQMTIRILRVVDGIEVQRLDLSDLGISNPISIAVHASFDKQNVWRQSLFVSGVVVGYEAYATIPDRYSGSLFSVLRLASVDQFSTYATAERYTVQPQWYAPTNLVVDEQGSLLFTSQTAPSRIFKVFQPGTASNVMTVAVDGLYPAFFSQNHHLSGMAADAHGNLVCCIPGQIAVRRRC